MFLCQGLQLERKDEPGLPRLVTSARAQPAARYGKVLLRHKQSRLHTVLFPTAILELVKCSWEQVSHLRYQKILGQLC